jgi:UDP-glucose 4-epimerase
MTVAWVLGSAGLLGAAICRTLRNQGTELFTLEQRFSWDSAVELPRQMATAVSAFAMRVCTADRWEIYWAAGIGTMSSSAESIAPETQAVSVLMNLLQSAPPLLARPGFILFASSAGAIYAGSSDDVITEASSQAPTTAYAYEKIKQEDLVRRFVLDNPSTAAVIARISTLYGPGQSAGKRQGLLSHVARSIIRNQPIQIYVPYDTIRDYIDADDAAEIMVDALRSTGQKPRVLTKIVASECPVTIAEIIGVFKRVALRAPKIVRVANRMSSLYSRRVQFRSVVMLDGKKIHPKRLPIGIARLMTAEHVEYARSR